MRHLPFGVGINAGGLFHRTDVLTAAASAASVSIPAVPYKGALSLIKGGGGILTLSNGGSSLIMPANSLLIPGVDFSLSGLTATFTSPLHKGDNLYVDLWSQYPLDSASVLNQVLYSFDPANKGPSIALSANNTIATLSTGGWNSTYFKTVFTGGSAQKRIFELQFKSWTDTSATMWGATLGASPVLTGHVGNNSTNFYVQEAYYATGHSVDFTFANTSGAGAISVNGYVQVAVDFAACKIWFSTPAGSGWVGGGSPDAGTSPSITFSTTSQVKFGVSLYQAGAVAVFNGQGSFSQNPGNVTSFTPWDI